MWKRKVEVVRVWAGHMGLLEREARERELKQELESHIQMAQDDNLRVGMTAAEARRDALIRLGGLQQTMERCRDAFNPRWLRWLTRRPW